MGKNDNEKAVDWLKKHLKSKALRNFFTVHDYGRKDPKCAQFQLNYLMEKSDDHINAWFLHHLIDLITHEENFKAGVNDFKVLIKRSFGDSSCLIENFNKTLTFVKENFDEISRDCQK